MGTVRHLLAESAGHDSPTPGELGKKPVGGVPRSPGSEGRSGLSRRFLERAGFEASGLLLQIKDLELLGGYWCVSLLLKDTMEWGPQALRLLSLPEAALESPSLTLWRGVPSSGLQGHGAGAGSERHGGECAPYFSVLFLGIPGQGTAKELQVRAWGPRPHVASGLPMQTARMPRRTAAFRLFPKVGGTRLGCFQSARRPGKSLKASCPDLSMPGAGTNLSSTTRLLDSTA